MLHTSNINQWVQTLKNWLVVLNDQAHKTRIVGHYLFERVSTYDICFYDNPLSLDQDTNWFLPIELIETHTGHYSYPYIYIYISKSWSVAFIIAVFQLSHISTQVLSSIRGKKILISRSKSIRNILCQRFMHFSLIVTLML